MFDMMILTRALLPAVLLGLLVACAPAQRAPGPDAESAAVASADAPGADGTPLASTQMPDGQTLQAVLADDYQIAPEDLLEIEVFGIKDLERTVRVNSTGHISLPLVGQIRVAGLTGAGAEALIAQEYGEKYLQDPQVSVFIKEFTTQRITVDGAVYKPGIYPIKGDMTLLRALALAGGGGQLADLENVMLFRLTPEGKPVSEKHDVLKIRMGEAPDPALRNDDMVVVNREPTRVMLRDSKLRDFIDFINPFSSSYDRMSR